MRVRVVLWLGFRVRGRITVRFRGYVNGDG